MSVELTFKQLLKSLNFEYDDELFRPLVELLAGAQEKRFSEGNSNMESVTRSTALVVLNQLQPSVSAGLRDAGMDWDKYCRDIGLSGFVIPNQVEDVEIHTDFATALMQFREAHPEEQTADYGTLTLAIIESATPEGPGLVGDRLLKAGAEPGRLATSLRNILMGVDSNQGTGQPTVWLLHYKDDDRPSTLISQLEPGSGIDWRSTKIIKNITTDDPVIYWRDISQKAGDRGGLVGTGRFINDSIVMEKPPMTKEKKDSNWHYYPTRVLEIFTDNPLARDELLKETGLRMNWGLGSILKVPAEMAKRVDAYLKSHGRQGLFIESAAEAAPDIVFIGDAPKTDEDFLQRGDLAFVLAARLNRVWDGINLESLSPQQHAGTENSKRFSAILRAFSECGCFRRNRHQPFDSGFVVHIDAPWGGGKTTFANYLGYILNPYRLKEGLPKWLADLPLHDKRFWPEQFRRPWHLVSFNAWQHQHLDPPWWCFYQAIRRQCFHDVRTGSFDVKHNRRKDATSESSDNVVQWPPQPTGEFVFPNRFMRHAKWLWLWLQELAWRLFNPKLRVLTTVFLLTWVVALILHQFGLFEPAAFGDALKKGLEQSKDISVIITTGLVILFGGATAIWSVMAGITETLLPGTPDAARNYSLGSGDPLERFRLHFDRMAYNLNRPILVIIDDIDRCNPGFVVELLRGIQTIIKSPRVIFVLLGDRDWIEHAFANVHSAMAGIDVGPEHTFGGRFVEKAIQLSLILPDITPESRTEYVRQLLRVTESKPEDSTKTLPKELEEDLERALNIEDPMSRDNMAASLREKLHAEKALKAPAKTTGLKRIDRQMALRSASDRRLQDATRHRLLPIAPVLPANPRQMKRIINGIALFQQIAQITQEIQPGSREWCRMALWVVIMTEWPKSWATLSAYPGLIDYLRSPDPKTDHLLPDKMQLQAWSETIMRNRPLMQLLDFRSEEGNWRDAALDTASIERFQAFMPSADGVQLPEPGIPHET